MDADAALVWTALIARLHADDERALREVIDLKYQEVVALAYRYVRTPDQARDVAQDAFIALWDRRHALRDDGSLGGYLRGITRNLALKLRARDASAARMEEALLREYMSVPPQDENLGMSTVEADEFNTRVHVVFAGLSPRVREVARLYHEDGLEPAEIATMLGVAPATVYGQLRKAMQALAAAFGDDAA